MRQGNVRVAGLAMLVVLLVAGPLAAQEPQPAEQAQEQQGEHVVRRGDTLWDLAGRYLGNPFHWPAIHQANTRIVADPHWIYPEQVLAIPGMRSRVEPWTRPLGDPLGRDVAGAAGRQVAIVAEADGPLRTVFYRDPEAFAGLTPTVLAEAQIERVPVTVGEFYRAEFLEQPGALPVMGRVVRSQRELSDRDRAARTAYPRDDLYVGYAGDLVPAVGDRFLVAEIGRTIRGSAVDARLIDPRAVVRVVEVEPEVIRVHIEEQFGRVLRDQVMLPLEFYPDFVGVSAEPLAGASDVQGQILEFVDDNPLPGKLARAFIDRGRPQGVQVGDVFEAYLPERRARSTEDLRRTGELLPEEAVAVLRVVRVTDLGATVVADEVMQPLLEAGLPVRRVARMP
jgi:hypothetical protein